MIRRLSPAARLGLGGLLALVVGAVVGVGRMAAGVHLPLDVVGGLGMGAAAAAVVVVLADR